MSVFSHWPNPSILTPDEMDSLAKEGRASIQRRQDAEGIVQTDAVVICCLLETLADMKRAFHDRGAPSRVMATPFEPKA